MNYGTSYDLFENKLNSHKDIIQSFGYKGHRLNPWVWKKSYTTAHSRFISQSVDIIGVSPYLFEAFEQDYIDSYYSSNSDLSFTEQLYTNEGFHGVGMGAYLSEKMHLFPNSKEEEQRTFLLNIQRNEMSGVNFYKLKSKFILNSIAGIRMGKRKLTRRIEVLVSLPMISHIYEDVTATKAKNFFMKY